MYSLEFKAKALEVLKECGGSLTHASKELGGVCTKTLQRWRDEQKKPPRRRNTHLSAQEKRSIADQLKQGVSVAKLADRFEVSMTTIYNIRSEAGLKGALSFMDDKESIRVPKIDLKDLPDDVEKLKRRCAELELDNAILEQTIEILKKDPGVDPSDLSNREKAMVIDALKDSFTVSALCQKLSISRSSYHYASKAACRPDRYRAERFRIKAIFKASNYTFGSERIWLTLKNGDDGHEPLRISEKVVRRIMRQEGLHVIYNKKKRSYSSYKGEISEHPGNKVGRNFHADTPNALWLTDITQFTLPGFKCYLSAIIDCFDGKVASYKLSRSPDAQLANATLQEALNTIRGSQRPILHSDCGCHYRWPEWVRMCNENGIVRSMSKKACSPDNAACEGFFGRLKNEFFYYRDWDGVTFEEFSQKLDKYIDYYNTRRRKKSLGWLSPRDYRLSMGYAA